MQKKISKLYQTLIWDNEISLRVLDTTAVVQEAIKRHNLTPLAAAALGRTLTVTAYLCSWLKEEKSTLSVSIDGGGAGGKIQTAGDGALRVRGYIENASVSLPLRADGKLNVGGCVGKNGTLTVIRDDGEGIPFVGTSELVTGEIAEDFSVYFLTSEQRPTAIAVGVRVSPTGECLGAGGVFLQPLPFAKEENIIRAEREIVKYGNISYQIADEGAEGVIRAFGAENLTQREIKFQCRCSYERAKKAVVSLSRADAEELVAQEGKISVHCHDCNTDYEFFQEDIAKIFEEKA